MTNQLPLSSSHPSILSYLYPSILPSLRLSIPPFFHSCFVPSVQEVLSQRGVLPGSSGFGVSRDVPVRVGVHLVLEWRGLALAFARGYGGGVGGVVEEAGGGGEGLSLRGGVPVPGLGGLGGREGGGGGGGEGWGGRGDGGGGGEGRGGRGGGGELRC